MMVSTPLSRLNRHSPRRLAGRARHLAPYWLAVLRGAPLEVQVKSLPRRTTTRVRWIDLRSISLATDVRDWRAPGDGFALRGDWDLADASPRPSIFESVNGTAPKAMTHNTIRAMLLDGQDYRETPQYNFMLQAVDQRKPEMAYGCTSRVEVDEYFDNLLDAFESMRRHGYLTQRELGGDPFDEIKLYVTRTGSWCHGNGGNHRIRMAEVLGIQWVPFVVAGAHWEWVVGLSRAMASRPRAAVFKWLTGREHIGELRRSPPTQHVVA